MQSHSRRHSWFFIYAGLLITALTGTPDTVQAQYRVATNNFVVVGNNAQLTQKIANLAEQYRRDLSLEWLGKELPRWRQKCPIRYRIEPHARGETSFAFTSGRASEPLDWDMQIFGPPDRLLDAVLPHEITHTIFATHFGRPLPRWADEGACTTVEHVAERAKNHQMLLRFLHAQPSRGIPFNRMFTLKEYPHDMLPLYAQGYSVARYLIMKKGKKHFVNYIGAGMNAESRGSMTQAWDRTTKTYYGYDNLSDLQVAWLDWVRQGSPMTPQTDSGIAIAQNSNDSRGAATFTRSVGQYPKSLSTFPEQESKEPSSLANRAARQTAKPSSNSWYARQAKLPGEIRDGKNAKVLR